ncbi:MAG: response regulator transcription factor [Spirochaetota bacterium]
MTENPTILIIEDDKDLVEAMKITLEKNKYRVASAYNPSEGLKKAQELKPDLIILDVMFGQQEQARGFDYAVKLKTDRSLSPIPILMLTAVNIKYPQFKFSPSTDDKYLPVDEFIDKPAQPDELLQKVKQLVEREKSIWSNWPDKTQNTERE